MAVYLAEKPEMATQEDMRQFMEDIRQFPLLTPEQERSLAQQCAQGDEDAIRHMVSANLRLVVSVAREYAGRGIAMLDLVQEGSIGLLTAARKFDYTLDYRFSTYATKWIRQGVIRALQKDAELIRVPAHTAEKLRKLSAARTRLQAQGLEADHRQLAQVCGMTEEKVRKLLQLEIQVCSLDAPAGEEDTIGLLVEDVRSPEPYEQLVREELARTMERLLDSLQERQKQVLLLRFGMMDGTRHSLEQIGLILGISKERARQIEKQAMEQLKKLGEQMGLEDFLV